MTKIILCGCFGHMGRVITDIVSKNNTCEIVAGVDIATQNDANFKVYSDIKDVSEDADVIIDFSHPSLLTPILDFAKGKVPVVLCTTGYTAEQVKQIELASEQTAIFYSRNMSLGINLLIELSKKASAILGNDFDIEIIEKHHNLKVDAPSGTALMIADAIASEREDITNYMYDRHAVRKQRDVSEIGIHAVRGGTIVGEHEVVFAGRHEVLSISHSAQSKELFANGAVNAGIFMSNKPAGLYDMSNMLDM
ncbi:MAG: 4-hydroxy-tetrahydrodipicolinate reductase [Clostridia bacterium]